VLRRTARATPDGVRVKVAEGCGITREKPEFEDVARLAREKGVSYMESAEAVLQSAGRV